MKKIGASIIFGIVCLILSSAITMQLKLTNTSESAASQAKKNDQLKDQILVLNDKNNKLIGKLQDTTKNLETIRDKAAQNNSSSVQKSELIKKYLVFIGYTDVLGQGVIIKYIPTKDQNKSDITADLRDVVNELKNAGAEAISINDQRLINTSSIEMVKNKIEINKIEISAPYTIKIIGNPEIINSSLIRPGGTIELIEDTGVSINIQIKEKVNISKYSENQ